MMWLKDRLVRNIILGVLALALLAGAYLLVLKIPEKTEETPDTQKEETSSASEYAIKCDSSDIESLYIKNDKDEFTVVASGEEWTVQGRNVEYSSNAIENSLLSFTNFYVRSKLENMTDEKCGLDVPAAEAVLKLKDGTVYNLKLGNEIVGDNGYFIKINDIIYTTTDNYALALEVAANDFRDKNLITFDRQSLERFKISNKDGVVANIINMDEAEASKISMNTTLVMTEPKKVAVSLDYLGKIFENLQTVTALDFVCDDRSEFGEYGLDVPVLTLEIVDANGAYAVNYGKKNDDGRVYANIGGTDSVFIQDPLMYDTLAKVDTLSLVEKFCHIIDIDLLKGVTVSGKGKSIVLTMEGEEGNEKFFCNGATANDTAFRRAYQEVIGLCCNGFADGRTASGPAEYSIVFSYKDGSELVCDYISYDERNYVLNKNGVREYVILKKNVAAMLQKLEAFAADPAKEA